MPVINISVKDKIARLETPVNIACNNSDYVIRFGFDAEWQGYETKTARFVISGKYIDAVFSGAEVAVPIISDARAVAIGVYAGNLHTTTPALIMCDGSITSEGGSPAAPSEDVYAQIMEMLNRNSGLWYPSVESGVLSWAKSRAEETPASADIRGPAGPQGIQGVQGERGPKGDKGDTGSATFEDDGNGNLTMSGVTAQTARRFLQSLTVSGLNFKYVNPIRSGTYSNPYGIYVGSGASLVDAVKALTEPGLYTVYQNRASTDAPAGAKAINSSLRGLVSLSQINKHYAFIFMVDQASNFYVQYIQNDVGGWKQMAALASIDVIRYSGPGLFDQSDDHPNTLSVPYNILQLNGSNQTITWDALVDIWQGQKPYSIRVEDPECSTTTLLVLDYYGTYGSANAFYGHFFDQNGMRRFVAEQGKANFVEIT